MRLRTYSELSQFDTFLERFDYLRIGGSIGETTFGHSRYINQAFYASRLWRDTRNEVIIRDNGCDLGIEDREIFDKIVVHHMNPVTEEDVETLSDFLLNPEYLICSMYNTHNAIHYGDESLLFQMPEERRPNDTILWTPSTRRFQ